MHSTLKAFLLKDSAGMSREGSLADKREKEGGKKV